MHRVLIYLMAFSIAVNSFYTSDYEDNTPRQFIEKFNEQDLNLGSYSKNISVPINLKPIFGGSMQDEPEPINTITSQSNGTNWSLDTKNLLCEDFEEYAHNCTYQAKRHYNSTMTLPFHHELRNWCVALQSLTTCECDWNMDCKDVTEKVFNELTIKGQLHILDKVCHDNGFLIRYDTALNNCIIAVSKEWKACYTSLKHDTDKLKNATNNWVHYETHFYLCCARTRFRSCTLELLLRNTHHCTPAQSLILQKFSSIVSDGEVFQDCNFNMVYPSCPGGDPRPPTQSVSKLMGDGGRSLIESRNSAPRSVAMRCLPLIILNYILE